MQDLKQVTVVVKVREFLENEKAPWTSVSSVQLRLAGWCAKPHHGLERIQTNFKTI